MASDAPDAEKGTVKLQALARGYLSRLKQRSSKSLVDKAESEEKLSSPYVPSSPEAIAQFLEFAKVQASDTVCDLGCGDGRVLIAAAKERGATAIGVELDENLCRRARENIATLDSDVAARIQILHCSIDSPEAVEALKKCTVVFTFMLPRINVFVRDTLLPVLPLGARIVTYTFRLGDVGVVAPTAVQQVNNEISNLYLYQVTDELREQLKTSKTT